MDAGQVLKQRYRLVARIAVGGMGEVWRATDEMLHRTVAIKILHPALAADPQFQRRFIQEARILASLNAPGLIDLYDACEEPGTGDSPLSYLVMELVDGQPLSSVLAERGRLDAATLLPILAQCATALRAAHGAGIVHRDIKPANILLAADGTVTVIDFGIARRPGDATLTAAGSVIGTVEYASPEQLRGETLTGACDIYSLGVVGYECLTGAPPFHGDTAAVITAHLNTEPAPLPATVPRAVTELIGTALAKDPSLRFASAAELADACRAAVPGTRVESVGRAAAPLSPTAPIDVEPLPEAPDPALRSLLRRRTVTTVAITLGVVVAILAVVGVFWWISGPTGETAEDKSSPPKSSSASPSPTGPDEPASSTLSSVRDDSCLYVDYGVFSDAVARGRCGGKSAAFEFVSGSGGGDDVFTIVNDYDGDKVCLNWSYGDDEVTPGECDFDVAWSFEWLETKAGYDVWRIHSVTNSKFCLAAGTEYPQGQDCNDDASQQWRTKAVED